MTPMPASTVISAAGAGTANEITSNPNTPATPARFNQLLMVLPPIISLADFIADFVARMEPPGPASGRPRWLHPGYGFWLRLRFHIGLLTSSGAPAGTGYRSTTNSMVRPVYWPLTATSSTRPH